MTVAVSIPVAFVKAIEVPGRNGTGPVSAPGVKVGDIIVLLIGTDLQPPTSSVVFNRIVTADDQIQQGTSADHSSEVFDVYLIRGFDANTTPYYP